MEEINLKTLFETRYPGYWNRQPLIIKKTILNLLGKILWLKEINVFISEHKEKQGIEFIDEIFEMLNFSFSITNRDIKRIPAEGRLLIVSNHPLGSLDGLALLKGISEIRKDVKIVANDLLLNIDNLKNLFIPYDLESSKLQRENIESIGKALQKEEAIIIFPAAEVSRLQWLTVTDSKWHKGAVYFSQKFETPVLPVFVNARNSIFFYLFSAINKNFSTFLLPGEMFRKRNSTIQIHIGNPVPAKAFESSFLKSSAIITLLRKHIYRIGKNKPGIFKSEKNIIHPIDRKLIKKELVESELLGETRDGKKIILTNFCSSPNVMNEIARLREVTFRSIGEGTGKKMDFDEFDRYYSHLVVWDENELEIVGSYRIGFGNKLYEEIGLKGLYTSTLFEYSEHFITKIVTNSIELGRSFVQKKYWNTNALDYLWQGIGALIAANPDIKYLFGAVSISNNYSAPAKNRLVYFYNKWFGSVNDLARSKNRFVIPTSEISILQKEFTGETYKADFFILKKMLKQFGFSVPVLYKHYSELCENDGVQFLDFGVDEDFENCIDGLLVVDLDRIKEEKKERYINQFLQAL